MKLFNWFKQETVMEETSKLSIDEAREQLETARADIRAMKSRYDRNRQLNAANSQVERTIGRSQRDIQLIKRQYASLGRSWEDDFRPS